MAEIRHFELDFEIEVAEGIEVLPSVLLREVDHILGTVHPSVQHFEELSASRYADIDVEPLPYVLTTMHLAARESIHTISATVLVPDKFEDPDEIDCEWLIRVVQSQQEGSTRWGEPGVRPPTSWVFTGTRCRQF